MSSDGPPSSPVAPPPSTPAGRHVLIELHDCDARALDDLAAIERLLVAAAEASGAHIVGTLFRRFEPQGVTGVVAIAESHLSIHTWPEHRYASVDYFTCGDVDPLRAVEMIARELAAGYSERMVIVRGPRFEVGEIARTGVRSGAGETR